MNRRLFLVLMAALTSPLQAQQPSKIPVVGVIYTHVPAIDRTSDLLLEALKKYGLEDGKNIRVDIVSAEGRVNRVPEIVQNFVRQGVDIIVCANEMSTRAAMKATKSIPIIMVGFAADPVQLGLVDSFNRPKGNVTGVHVLAAGLDGKRLQRLKDALPRLSKVAVFWQRPFGARASVEAFEAGKVLGLDVSLIELTGADDFEAAFRAAAKQKVQAISITWSPVFYMHRERLGALALRFKLPVIGADSVNGAGILMSYGTDSWESWKRAAYYVHRLLTDSKPRDLPVEQISTFKLRINMKTATALRITFPETILVFADEVIR